MQRRTSRIARILALALVLGWVGPVPGMLADPVCHPCCAEADEEPCAPEPGPGPCDHLAAAACCDGPIHPAAPASPSGADRGKPAGALAAIASDALPVRPLGAITASAPAALQSPRRLSVVRRL